MNDKQFELMTRLYEELSGRGLEFSTALENLQTVQTYDIARVRNAIGISNDGKLDNNDRDLERYVHDSVNKSDKEIQAEIDKYDEEKISAELQDAVGTDRYEQLRNEYRDAAILRERAMLVQEYRKEVKEAIAQLDRAAQNLGNVVKKDDYVNFINELKGQAEDLRKTRESHGGSIETRMEDMLAKNNIEKINDFVEFYSYYSNVFDKVRDLVPSQLDAALDEFNANIGKVQAKDDRLDEKYEKLNAERQQIVRDLDEINAKIEVFEMNRDNTPESPNYGEYLDLTNERQEISNRLSNIDKQILKNRKQVKGGLAIDVDLDSYDMSQRDLNNLSVNLKNELGELGDIRNAANLRSGDARDALPRFEYAISEEGIVELKFKINGMTKKVVLGKYDEVDKQKAATGLLGLIQTIALNKGFDINELRRTKYQFAHATKDGLQFLENDNNLVFNKTSFSYIEIAEKLSGLCKDMKKTDEEINDIRNMMDEPESPVPTMEPEGPENNPDGPENNPDGPENNPDGPENNPEGPEVPTEPEHDNDNGYRVVSSRPYSFNNKTKVGNDNDKTRTSAVDPFYKEFLNQKLIKKIITPIIAGAGLFTFGLFGSVPTLIGAAGAIGVAAALNASPEAIKNARIHKLNKLAKSLGCKLGYDIDENHYGMYFVDENGKILSDKEVKELAEEAGIDAQAQLDKIANNATRGLDASGRKINEREFANKYIVSNSKPFIENLNALLEPLDLKVDTYYFAKTGGKIAYVDIDEELLPDDVRMTEEIQREVESKHKIAEGLDPSEEAQIKDEIKDIVEANYDTKLLFNKKNTELRKNEKLREVNFDNLIETFDDLGGIRLVSPKKQSRLAAWFKKKFGKNNDFEEMVEVESDEYDFEPEEEVEVDMTEEAPGEVLTEEVPEPEEVEAEMAEEAPAQEPIVNEDVEYEEPEVDTSVAPQGDAGSEASTASTTGTDDIDINDVLNNIIAGTTEGLASDVQDIMGEENAPVEEAPAQPAPEQAAPVEETPAQAEPAQAAPVEEAPAQAESEQIPGMLTPEEIEALLGNMVPNTPVAPANAEVTAEQPVQPVASTYVTPEQLQSELAEKIDYEPQNVQAYMSQHMDAAGYLLPTLVSRNKDLAAQFIDSNIAAHPELQSIYDQALAANSNTMSL